MSVLTKKHPTVPLAKWPETRRALRALKVKVEEEDEFIPWRQMFPELKDEDMPGLHLQAARHHFGLTQAVLSQKTGIPQRHISEMENGKRSIGKKTAKILAKALKFDYRLLL